MTRVGRIREDDPPPFAEPSAETTEVNLHGQRRVCPVLAAWGIGARGTRAGDETGDVMRVADVTVV